MRILWIVPITGPHAARMVRSFGLTILTKVIIFANFTESKVAEDWLESEEG